MLSIANHWQINYDLLPKEETFYRAIRKGLCGNAMLEKLAIFYFAMVEPHNFEALKVQYLKIIDRERLPLTPNWDRFKEEIGKKNVQSDLSDLQKPFVEQLKKLKPKEMQRVLEWLKKELGE